MKRILVVGAGGVGGYFGARLARAGLAVTFLARGRHLRALKRRGLRVVGPGGNWLIQAPAFERLPRAVKPFDLILICVKAYETKPLISQVRRGLHAQSLVISLQNGLDQHKPWVRAFGRKRVAAGLCYLSAHVREPGLIEHVASGRIFFGELDPKQRGRLKPWVRLFRRAGIETREEPDIRRRQWEKLVWNVGFNGPTALVDLPVGELLKRKEQRILIRSLMIEAVTVAKAEGVALGRGLVAKTMRHSARHFPTAETSMQRDRRVGSPLEWEIFYGLISRRGKRHKIATPAHDLVGGLLCALSSPETQHRHKKYR